MPAAPSPRGGAPGTSNAFRQAVIACVKGELQQPYNLGVITRDQFVKVCSTVTKEFLKTAARQGQVSLTSSDEVHLRSYATALLTEQIGEPQEPVSAPSKSTADRRTAHVSHDDDSNEHVREAHNMDMPGAVLAATDSEVMKYQEHLSRLSKLTMRPNAGSRSGHEHAYGDGSLTPRSFGSGRTVSMAQSEQPRTRHTGMTSVGTPRLRAGQETSPGAFRASLPRTLSTSRPSSPASHTSAAHQLHADILSYVKRIEELHALVDHHLQTCEAAM
ncbi:hypothetical protein DIPPA_06320 [Diplonema papillatum]|nr:hypothetical protein DIPPA_06320 [Diplonema papillatum]